MNKRLQAVRVGALTLGLLGSCTAVAAPPAAQEEVERGRMFFNAGAQAYAAGRYRDAVRSFEQAYAHAPRPSVLFSLAQAERKEFLEHEDARVLKSAIEHYKRYLAEQQSGGRRSEAVEAKAELEARLARLDSAQLAALAVQSPEKRKPRVTVVSPTPGAHASFDGGPAEELPFFADLEPGKHVVRVFGEGYFDKEQEVSGDRGIDVPMSVALTERPARVTVALATRAEVYVDGRVVAETPTPRTIEVPPGTHVIAIVKNGRRAWSEEVVLERDTAVRVEPKLETSTQRWLSYGLLGAGGVTLALGGVFALTALAQQNQAEDIEGRRQSGNLSAADLDLHNRAIEHRDQQRTASIVLASSGAALALGGLLLYAFDTPPVASSPARPEPKPRGVPVDRTASLRPYPWVASGSYGVGLISRF